MTTFPLTVASLEEDTHILLPFEGSCGMQVYSRDTSPLSIHLIPE